MSKFIKWVNIASSYQNIKKCKIPLITQPNIYKQQQPKNDKDFKHFSNK